MRFGIVTDTGEETQRYRACKRLCEAGSVRGVVAWQRPASEEDLWRMADGDALASELEDVNVLFLDVPVAFSYAITHHAITHGVHVFLEHRSCPAMAEAESLGRLAEEARVEVGVSRPLRFHPLLSEWPAGWHSSLTTVRHTVSCGQSPQALLEEAVDLCCFLASTVDIRRLDAHAVRGEPGVIDRIAATLRFQNGSYAQIQVGRVAIADEHRVYVSGRGMQSDIDLCSGVSRGYKIDGAENDASRVAFTKSLPPHDAVYSETLAFIEAILAGKPAPASIADVVHEQRIVGSILRKLR